MTPNAKNLKSRLAKLSERDRAELAFFLIDSLDDESDADVDRAWEQELKRRLKDLDSGKVKGIPAEAAFKRLREKYS